MSVSPQLAHFDEAPHTYTATDHVVVPSVSDILRRAGLKSYAGIPEEVLAAKRELGRQVHRATHYLDEKDLDWKTVSSKYEPFVRAYEKFKKESGFIVDLANIEKPRIVFCDGMRYGVTPDRTGFAAGKLFVVELKCTAEEHPAWGVQLAAQEIAMRSEDAICRQRMSVRLLDNGDYRIKMYGDIQDYRIFKSALFLEWWKRNAKL